MATCSFFTRSRIRYLAAALVVVALLHAAIWVPGVHVPQDLHDLVLDKIDVLRELDSPATSKPIPPTSALSPTERVATQIPPPRDYDAASLHFDVSSDSPIDAAGPRSDEIVVLTASDGRGNFVRAVKDNLRDALQNRQEYCDAHGYICHFVNMTRMPFPDAVWNKLPAIAETFQTYPEAQWIWMLDLDAIIMNSKFDLARELLSPAALRQRISRNESIITDQLEVIDEKYKKLLQRTRPLRHTTTPTVVEPENIHVIVAQASNGINAGSFFIRRTTFTRMLLDVWSDPVLMDFGLRYKEQSALVHLMLQHPSVRSHVGLVPLHLIQARYSKDGKPGDEYGWRLGDVAVHFPGCSWDNKCLEYWTEMWEKRTRTESWQ